MYRMALLAISIGLGTGGLFAQEPPSPLLTQWEDPAVDLARLEVASGRARGWEGVQYDNRDSGHSRLNSEEWPELSFRQYTDDEKSRQTHLAVKTTLESAITIGNCSMAAARDAGGCIPRLNYYPSARNTLFLYRQYRASNLYIYPAHHDFQEGSPLANQGDALWANSPYILLSRGSSWSDLPHLKSLLVTLAAMPAGVRDSLESSGLLMPTLQMIYRRARVKSDSDYLEGKAHPVAFEGKHVPTDTMVKLVTSMKPEDLPPLVRLQLKHAPPYVAGRDGYSLSRSEVLFQTPCAIAMALRRIQGPLEIQVQATAETAPGQKPASMEYRWVLLQGDPSLVQIEVSKDGLEANLRIHHSDPVSVPSPRPAQSARVDIGVFARSGTWWSPPSFISVALPVHEVRHTDKDGQLKAVYFGGQTTDVILPDHASTERWTSFLQAIQDRRKEPAFRALRDHLSLLERTELAQIRKILEAVQEKGAPPQNIPKWEGGPIGQARRLLIRALAGMTSDLDWYPRERDWLDKAIQQNPAETQGVIQEHLARITRLGLSPSGPKSDTWTLPDLPIPDEVRQLWCDFLLRGWNQRLITHVAFPDFLGKEAWKELRAGTDLRIFRAAPWMDVYHRNAKGDITGWTRLAEDGRVEHYDASGRLITGETRQLVQYVSGSDGRLVPEHWLKGP